MEQLANFDVYKRLVATVSREELIQAVSVKSYERLRFVMLLQGKWESCLREQTHTHLERLQRLPTAHTEHRRRESTRLIT
jgi:hypothetical protein